MSQLSVENLQRKLVAFASRPVVEFNKHDALELLDSLRETARDAISMERANIIERHI